MSCVLALAFWYGCRLIAKGQINTKSPLEILLVLVSTSNVIANAGTMTINITEGSNSVVSVFAILDQDIKIDPEDPKYYRPKK